MAREPRHIQQAFNSGELSPRLYSRFDLAKYQHGCKTLENFIPLIYGGVKRRAGSRFVARAKFNPAIGASIQTPTANEVGVGGGWTNPNDAHTSNNVYATATPGAAARISTLWKTFGFDGLIPAGNTIREVFVLCEYNVSATTGFPLRSAACYLRSEPDDADRCF